MAEEEPVPREVSRRNVLRGAAIGGGALVWAVPVVQTVGMARASAVSGPPGKGPRFITITNGTGEQLNCTSGPTDEDATFVPFTCIEIESTESADDETTT